jgi:hypothetical protein
MYAVDGKNLLTDAGMAATNKVRTSAKSNNMAKINKHFFPQTLLRQ